MASPFAVFRKYQAAMLAVFGVYVLRRKAPDLPRPFRVPWYPWPMIIYVCITLATLVFVLGERPVEALVGGALILAGWLFYLVSRDRVGGEEHIPE